MELCRDADDRGVVLKGDYFSYCFLGILETQGFGQFLVDDDGADGVALRRGCAGQESQIEEPEVIAIA